jgi:hypothetical protein
MTLDPQALQGRWVHAHELDSGDEMVFVRGDTELPPSRGRQRLELRDGGDATEEGPGEADKPRAIEARWTLTNDDELVITSPEGREKWRARVVSAEPGRFVLDRGSLR